MIPIGYTYKRVYRPTRGFEVREVEDVYSFSDCLSKSFADSVDVFVYNRHKLFDSPAVMRALAAEHSIPLDGLALFYYELHEAHYDQERACWVPLAPDTDSAMDVEVPAARTLEGFDVVCFWDGSRGCSPLSCNGLAREVPTNRHCLLPSFEAAVEALESGRFAHAEPGPFRILAVYSASAG